MLDVVIKEATIVNGTGADAFTGDIGIVDGVIAEIGRVSTNAGQTVNAAGAHATPGWIDVHTHFDGQVSWDDKMDPSASHGVTSVVMGNCGVGFAPAPPGGEARLIELMEGVEDIPGTALYEGIEWGPLGNLPRVPRLPGRSPVCPGYRHPDSAQRGTQLRHGRTRPAP